MEAHPADPDGGTGASPGRAPRGRGAWMQVASRSPPLSLPDRPSHSRTSSLPGIRFRRRWESQLSGDLSACWCHFLPPALSLRSWAPGRVEPTWGPCCAAGPWGAVDHALAPLCLSHRGPAETPRSPCRKGFPYGVPTVLSTLRLCPATHGLRPLPELARGQVSRGPPTQPPVPRPCHTLSAAADSTRSGPHPLSEPPGDPAVRILNVPPRSAQTLPLPLRRASLGLWPIPRPTGCMASWP